MSNSRTVTSESDTNTVGEPSAEPVEVALGRRALREPPAIVTVVVDHVVLPRPRQAVGSQLPPHPRRRGVLRAAAGRHDDARAGRVPAVRRDERRRGPVGFDAPALRRPALAVPQAAVHPHRLPAQVRHAGGLVVPEHAHRHAVHRPAVSIANLRLKILFSINKEQERFRRSNSLIQSTEIHA